jgi:hypothetical protein
MTESDHWPEAASGFAPVSQDGHSKALRFGSKMMLNSPRLRICERCWRLIPAASVCRVQKHYGNAHPTLAPLLSFRHLESDPECTGAQHPAPAAEGVPATPSAPTVTEAPEVPDH